MTSPSAGPDDRLSVFISSDAIELRAEQIAARTAVERLRMNPVAFDLDASVHPAARTRDPTASEIFIGIYGERYGAPTSENGASAIELEFVSAGERPKLVYLKDPIERRDLQLERMIARISDAGSVSYKKFSTPDELEELIENDLALLLSENFDAGARTMEDSGASRGLPADITPMIGRDQDVAQISDLLRSQGVRLLTITGEGGIGKSRVGVAVARSFEDMMNVHFVALAGTSSGPLVIPAIGQAMAIRPGTTEVEDAVIEAIGSSPTLLLLDNFEQVLTAAPEIARLLERASDLKVIVTSRSVLRVRGECEYMLAPLSFPDDEKKHDAAEYPAVRLFVDRVRAARPDFEPADDDLALAAAICRRLDGLPLAIELAAARVRVLSLTSLLARLTDRFAILGGGARDAPDRQQTLSATIDWSYQLLDEEEQKVFARLGVFVGGGTLKAAEETCDPDGVYDVLGVITSLVEKSLMRREDGVAGKARFTMLESIHDFALRQLERNGELDELRARHAAYFAGFAQMAAAQMRGPQGTRWVGRLAEEHGNMRSALRWANDADPSVLQRLVSALGHFWMAHGDLAEGLLWTERALKHQVDPSFHVDLLLHRAELLWGLGRREEAATVYQECRRWSEENDDQRGIDLALRGAGRIALDVGDYERARKIYETSLAHRRKLGWTQGTAETLNNLGLVASLSGDDEAAVPLLEECSSLFREIDDQQGIARAALNLSISLHRLGKLDEAENQGKESLRVWHALDGKWDITDCLEALAMIAVDRDDPRKALTLMGAAEQLRRDIAAPRAPFDEEPLTRTIARARAQLDSEAEEILLAASTMPLDDAIEVALR